MKADRTYYITALPTPGDLGSEPPLSPAQLLEHVAGLPKAARLVETLFLLDDLLQREAFLAGELESVEPVVLTADQAKNEAALPACLAPGEREIPPAAAADPLWEAYFRHAAKTADKLGNRFLACWVGYEVALRNGLTEARAKNLDLDPADYIVAGDLADTESDLSAVINEWVAAETPLAGLRVLIRARWAWISEHDAWFTFSDDELAAYAARLMLLDQWSRVDKGGKSGPHATGESSGSLERTPR